MRLRNIYILMAVIAMMAASGCHDEKVNHLDIPGDAVYDIVTLESTGSKGSVFTMRISGDMPLINYNAPYDFSKSETLKVGNRLTLCYRRIDGATYTPGTIEIFGYSTMANTDQNVLKGTPDDYRQWESQPMRIQALWRTGQYINMQAELFVLQAKRPKTFVLVADEATIDSPQPDLHVVYVNLDGNNGDNQYPVRASFDISDVWDLPSCTSVRICYPTQSGTAYEIFDKPNN